MSHRGIRVDLALSLLVLCSSCINRLGDGKNDFAMQRKRVSLSSLLLLSLQVPSHKPSSASLVVVGRVYEYPSIHPLASTCLPCTAICVIYSLPMAREEEANILIAGLTCPLPCALGYTYSPCIGLPSFILFLFFFSFFFLSSSLHPHHMHKLGDAARESASLLMPSVC